MVTTSPCEYADVFGNAETTILVIYTLSTWSFYLISMKLNCFKTLFPDSSEVNTSFEHLKEQTVQELRNLIDLPVDIIRIVVYDYTFDGGDLFDHCCKLNETIKFKSSILSSCIMVYIIVGIFLYVSCLINIIHLANLWKEDEIEFLEALISWFIWHGASYYFSGFILWIANNVQMYHSDIAEYSTQVALLIHEFVRHRSDVYITCIILANGIIVVPNIVYILAGVIIANAPPILVMLFVGMGPVIIIDRLVKFENW